MKRKAFILTEILTGMTLQAMFTLTLCGAFYILLSFSTSTQQILSAQDEGQIVISYIDTRIKNAGLGMWKCGSPENIRKAFTKISELKKDKLALPVAITTTGKIDESVSEDGVYKGNVLTLLYARKDPEQSGGLIISSDVTSGVSINNNSSSAKNRFFLLGGRNAYKNSSFNNAGNYNNINNYAVIESSGCPVITALLQNWEAKDVNIIAPTTYFNDNIDIYPLSELLNIKGERMYVDTSTEESSFMIRTLGVDSSGSKSEWHSPTPHTKGILEIYMELDTKQDIPIFDLMVLVSEGKSDGTTEKPENWPSDYWDEEEFSKHKVHVSRASWKLYNLAPLDYSNEP